MAFDTVYPLLAGILVWSLLMLGVEMGNAMTEAFARRKH